jgi:polar amino acid transport system permease protein
MDVKDPVGHHARARGEGGRAVATGADTTVVPLRHPARWLAASVLGVVVASLIFSAARNDRFQWDVVASNLFNSRVLSGLWLTLWLTAVSMGIGLLLGIVLATMRLSPNPVLRIVSGAYIWIFRGTPLLVQLLFWSFIAAVYPKLNFGVPFGGPSIVSFNGTQLISPLTAAILGLGLNQSAYQAEIVRAGLLAVDEGQVEAAHALGLTRGQTLRRVVLPQAMRVIIPPTGNETINMLKTTSLVSVVAVTELLYAVQLIYAQNYQQIPYPVIASIWYLFFTTVLSVGQHYLERRFSRGSSRRRPESTSQRLRAWLAARRIGGVA